jgi:hypothetical protein
VDFILCFRYVAAAGATSATLLSNVASSITVGTTEGTLASAGVL